MKAQMRKELLEIILVSVIIVVTFFIGYSFFASTNQSSSESFKGMVYSLNEFISSDKNVSYPMPYYIDQGYFLMVQGSDTLIICGKGLCKEQEPLSKHKFEGYKIEVIGNRMESSINQYVITGDPGFFNLQGNRGIQNIIFKRSDKASKSIQIIDCSTKEWRKSDDCLAKKTEVSAQGATS